MKRANQKKEKVQTQDFLHCKTANATLLRFANININCNFVALTKKCLILGIQKLSKRF